MLEGHPEVRARYVARFPNVLVDEYQDVNLPQERLVELVAAGGSPFVGAAVRLTSRIARTRQRIGIE